MDEEGKKQKVGVGVGVLVLNKDGKALLGRRNPDPKKATSLLKGAGTWTLPGGKLDFGETFEQGAAREVLEETGIRVGKLKVICVNCDRAEGIHFVTIGLLCEGFSGEPIVAEPEEIIEWRWFSLADLPAPLFPPSAKLIRNYLAKEFYIPGN
ncbi:MAG: NUDIX domain-containing protein [archaeon]